MSRNLEKLQALVMPAPQRTSWCDAMYGLRCITRPDEQKVDVIMVSMVDYDTSAAARVRISPEVILL